MLVVRASDVRFLMRGLRGDGLFGEVVQRVDEARRAVVSVSRSRDPYERVEGGLDVQY